MKRLPAGLAICLLAIACGKKGDPQPPLPRGPNAVKDLAVEQEGDDAVLTFTFPDRLQTGEPLTDLGAIEVYRVVDPPAALTAPPRAAGPAAPPTSAGSSGELHGMGAAARRTATNVRMAEEAFYGNAGLVAGLSLAAIAEATRGASVVYRDSLLTLFTQEKGPEPLAYAVVSVRKNGERSLLSNIVLLAPEIAPQAPELRPPLLEEGRVCLEWTAPEKNVLQQPVEIGGYRVYRRPLSQDAYETPLTATPVPGTSFVDLTAPYGVPLAYTVRAVLAKNPKVEGLPAEEIIAVPRDIYPPKSPTRVDALSEANLVRLLWDPVDSADLAGYLVFRSEAGGPPVPLTKEPIVDPFFNDLGARPGKKYAYTVRAVDRAGNQSAPSPEAVAEPF